MRPASILLLIGALSSFVLTQRVGAQSNRDDLTPLDIGYTVAILEDQATVRIDLEDGAKPLTRVAVSAIDRSRNQSAPAVVNAVR